MAELHARLVEAAEALDDAYGWLVANRSDDDITQVAYTAAVNAWDVANAFEEMERG